MKTKMVQGMVSRQTDLDDLSDEGIQDVAMTFNLTPRKCLGFKTPAEAFLSPLGNTVTIRFNATVALRGSAHQQPSGTALTAVGNPMIQEEAKFLRDLKLSSRHNNPSLVTPQRHLNAEIVQSPTVRGQAVSARLWFLVAWPNLVTKDNQ